MSRPVDVPRLFALTRGHEDTSLIVGYGMVLPDGTTHSVSWPTPAATSYYSAASAEQTARLRNATLLWLDDQP